MANERRSEPRRQQPAREARSHESEPVVHDRSAAEEPLDEQSLDRVMRECPL
jgi:hypothetical protein